jgi:phosphoribosylanthranilate isomerase
MVRIKVCGITNLPDALVAAASGVDLLGFIFFPGSPRYVTPEQVRVIVASVRDSHPGVQAVGVFVNESPQTICQVLGFCDLQLAQLHGEEPPQVLGLDHQRPSVLRGRTYKALRPRSLDEARQLTAAYALPPSLQGMNGPPAFLLDTYHSAQRGGTGQAGDWTIAACLAREYPLLLAGGLSPANVAHAVHRVRPWGVDVASGIETAPGRKDHDAVRAFITAAQGAASRLSAGFRDRIESRC